MERARAWVALVLALAACGKSSTSGSKAGADRCDRPMLVVEAGYPGASAEHVERLVLEPLEAAVAPVARHLYGVAYEGRARLVVIPDGDLDAAKARVIERLGDLSQLPDDVERPVVHSVSPSAPGFAFALRGELAAADIQFAADLFWGALASSPGIARADVLYVARREMRVEVDADRLAAMGLGPDAIARAIAGAANADELGSAVVRPGDAGVVFLRDVAAVREAFRAGPRADVDGRPAAVVVAFGDEARIRAVAREVDLPPGLEIVPLGRLGPAGCEPVVDDAPTPARTQLRVRLSMPVGVDRVVLERERDRLVATVTERVPAGATVVSIAGGWLGSPRETAAVDLLVLADAPLPAPVVAAAADQARGVAGAAVEIDAPDRRSAVVRFGHDELDELHRAVAAFRAGLGPDATATVLGGEEPIPTVDVRLTDRGRALGVTNASLAAALRVHAGTARAGEIRTGTESIPVVVAVAGGDRTGVTRARVQTSTGEWIPVAAVADVTVGQAPAAIAHADRQRVLYVRATARREVLDESVRAGTGAVTRQHPDVRIERID